jgi:hypothetical protein
MVMLDIDGLRQKLGRQTTDEEMRAVFDYIAFTQRPKPQAGDPMFERFHRVRVKTFSLYREASQATGNYNGQFDDIINESEAALKKNY